VRRGRLDRRVDDERGGGREDQQPLECASIATEPKITMTWPVHGLNGGSGWRAAP